MTDFDRREFLGLTAAMLVSPRPAGAQATPPPGDAMATLRRAIPIAEADPERPVYHFRPPANWNNDPNGTIFHRGWHHLFYQLNPAAPRGGNQHWGHARSRDLVNWEHLPIALAPSPDRRERAIFSGCAIEGADGKVRLFYTSIGHPVPEQWMAVPLDDELIRWDKPAFNPVVAADVHGRTPVFQWRDPFTFREGGRTYMVLGGNLNNSQGGGGVVLLYRATNAEMTKWEYLGVVHQYRDRQIWNVECPNLFKLGDKWVLIMSPQQPCEYFIGTLDLSKPAFTAETHGILDAGNSYASNISVDDKGRTILWLWGRTNTSPEKGWNGVMVMPRILSIGADGFLRQEPAPEFEKLRGAAVSVTPSEIALGTPTVLDAVRGDSLEIDAEFVMGGAGEVGFDLRRSADGKPGVTVRVARNGSLMVGNVRAAISRALDRYRLRIFLDKRVVEVYVNDGEAAIYSTVEAGLQDLGVAVVANAPAGRGGGFAPPAAAGRGGQAPGAPLPLGGGRGTAPSGPPRLQSLRAWTMRPATFDLARFKA
jgi:beta-fructofuranosidase